MINMISKNVSGAVEIATSFLRERYPVSPQHICKELGIKIVSDKPLEKDGYLICYNGKKVILVSNKINNHHRRDFIIAHELGHFLLHRNLIYSCNNVSEFSSYNLNTQGQESEANEFASELLMPNSELGKQIPVGRITFQNIFDISNLFGVSVTHAAMKAVTASKSEDEVLICYEHKKLKWYKSANKYTYPRMIPKDCPIQVETWEKETNVNGIWESLYHGTVHQEIFSPIPGQHLILLSGKRT